MVLVAQGIKERLEDLSIKDPGGLTLRVNTVGVLKEARKVFSIKTGK
jgi:hypothetical protein